MSERRPYTAPERSIRDVMAAVRSLADEGAIVTRAGIAARCGLSERTVKRIIPTLVDAGKLGEPVRGMLTILVPGATVSPAGATVSPAGATVSPAGATVSPAGATVSPVQMPESEPPRPPLMSPLPAPTPPDPSPPLSPPAPEERSAGAGEAVGVVDAEIARLNAATLAANAKFLGPRRGAPIPRRKAEPPTPAATTPQPEVLPLALEPDPLPSSPTPAEVRIQAAVETLLPALADYHHRKAGSTASARLLKGWREKLAIRLADDGTDADHVAARVAGVQAALRWWELPHGQAEGQCWYQPGNRTCAKLLETANHLDKLIGWASERRGRTAGKPWAAIGAETQAAAPSPADLQPPPVRPPPPDGWVRILERIRAVVSAENFETYFTPVVARQDGGLVTATVDDGFFGDWALRHYRDLMAEAAEAEGLGLVFCGEVLTHGPQMVTAPSVSGDAARGTA